MNVRRWIFGVFTALALVACGTPAAQTVARLDNVTLTRQTLDERIGRIQEAAKAQGGDAQLPPALDIEKSLVDLFIQQNLVLSVARQRGVTVSDQEVDTEIESLRNNFAQQGSGTLEDAITGQLGFTDVAAPDFRQLVSYLVAQQKLASTLVQTDTVRQELNDQLQTEAKQEVMKADVAHILVATEEEAQQVLDRLGQGEKFEDLAKELSTDPGSSENGGLYEGVTQGQMVAEFDKATFEDLQPGETTATPVQTEFGYHIIKLISRTSGPQYTDEQVQQLLEQQLPMEVQQRQGLALQELLDTEREKAIAEGRLVEPTYPEPTEVIPGDLPQDAAPEATSETQPEPTAQP